MILLYELKKVFIKNKGIIIILIAIILKLIVCSLQNYNVNYTIEEYKKEYNQYIDELGGALVPSKEEKIKKVYEQISNIDVKMTQIKNEYLQEKIESEILCNEIEKLDELKFREKIFNIFYDQYLYVKEEPNERYLINGNGWNALLCEERLDFILILVLLVLTTPIFCLEYESDMHYLLCSTKKGRVRLGITKISTAFLISIIITLLFCLIEYLFVKNKFGLSYAYAPLKSLAYFCESNNNQSLIVTYVKMSACKILGATLFSLYIILFSIISKKMIITLFSSLSIIVIPYLISSIRPIIYLIPLPIGPLLGSGYIKEIQLIEIMFIFLIIEMIVLIIISLILYTDNFNFINKKCKTFSLLLVMGLLVGCGKEEAVYVSDYNLMINANYNEVKGYEIIYSNQILSIDKRNGEIEQVIRDPFCMQDEMRNFIIGTYVFNEKLYYLKKNNRDISIFELDLETYNSHIIYNDCEEKQPFFLGEGYIDSSDEKEIGHIHSFFLDQKNIYLYMDDGIIKVNRITQNKTKIVNDVAGSVAFNGKNIYYINDKYQLVTYDLMKGTSRIIPKVRTEYFYLCNDKIYYINSVDHNRIYSIDLLNEENNKILDVSANSCVCDDKYLYYSNKDDQDYLYRMNFKDKMTSKVASLECYWIYLLKGARKIYVPIDDFRNKIVKTYSIDTISLKIKEEEALKRSIGI